MPGIICHVLRDNASEKQVFDREGAVVRSERTDEGNRGAPVAAVNLEIAIERPDHRVNVLFTHADQAGIGKRHGEIGVGGEQTAVAPAP
jgi:hypothetical protein